MKKQTYIVLCVNAENKTIDFYRFSCKKAETAKRNVIEAVKGSSLWVTIWAKEGVTRLICCATPDGSTEEKIVWEISMDELKIIANERLPLNA